MADPDWPGYWFFSWYFTGHTGWE